ncbi:glycosyltransferase [bacterium]|nr:glycosyltransferase [bacterium]
MKIIAIIATKNRIELLAKSLQSIEKQIIKPSEIIVTSDSDEQYQNEEDELCKLYHATLIHNHLTKNYAGNLNSAITYLVKQFINNLWMLDNIYLAFLDDDDT